MVLATEYDVHIAYCSFLVTELKYFAEGEEVYSLNY